METKRCHRVKVAYSNVEQEKLRQKAERRGMKLAAFIRWCTLNCPDAAAAA